MALYTDMYIKLNYKIYALIEKSNFVSNYRKRANRERGTKKNQKKGFKYMSTFEELTV